MSNYLQQYFTTGQFAKLFGLNKRTLMYYNDIGLFTPAITKDNGYRYYSNYQGPLLDAILTLRDMGTPLEEIKKLLKHRSPTTNLSLLHAQKKRLEEEAMRIKYRRAAIDNKIKLIEIFLEKDENNVFLEECPTEYLLLTPIPENTNDEDWFDLSYQHMKECFKVSLYGESAFNLMIGMDCIKEGNYYNYSYLYARLLDKQSTPHFIKPKGMYLQSFCKGDWENIPKAYQIITDYADKHGLTLTGYAYEQTVLDEASTAKPKDFVVKISVKVE